MSKEGSPDPSAVAGIVPAADLKALLKDSLLEILRENPALIRPSEEAGSGSRSGKPSRQCTVYGSFGVCVLFYAPSAPSGGEPQWCAGRRRALPSGYHVCCL